MCGTRGTTAVSRIKSKTVWTVVKTCVIVWRTKATAWKTAWIRGKTKWTAGKTGWIVAKIFVTTAAEIHRGRKVGLAGA